MEQWILYDVGGVLEIVDDDRWPDVLRETWGGRFGLTVDEVRTRLRDADLPDMALRTGVADEYWRKLGAALGATPTEVATMHAEFWDAYCGVANVELLEHARSLRGRAKLAILSNSGDGAREEEERRFGFSSIFDPICYSHEQGVAKPDPGAYTTALARMGALPEQVLFIDDNEGPVRGAERCGISAVLHVRNEETIAAIEGFLAG
ncbi:HAD-IA family hydrolase [Curtobacterium luteum]|uniref:HAD-IA family hydrolase n=1 Tax=Curtobacterium luteum TaxID=33881 RepID=UPI003815A677